MSTNKSFSTETSERYSRALFEVASETKEIDKVESDVRNCLLYTSPSPRDRQKSRMPSSA